MYQTGYKIATKNYSFFILKRQPNKKKQHKGASGKHESGSIFPKDNASYSKSRAVNKAYAGRPLQKSAYCCLYKGLADARDLLPAGTAGRYCKIKGTKRFGAFGRGQKCDNKPYRSGHSHNKKHAFGEMKPKENFVQNNADEWG